MCTDFPCSISDGFLPSACNLPAPAREATISDQLRCEIQSLTRSLSGCKTHVAKSTKLRSGDSQILEIFQSISKVLTIGDGAAKSTAVTGHLETDRVVLLVCSRDEMHTAADGSVPGPALLKILPQQAHEAVALLSHWDEEAVVP